MNNNKGFLLISFSVYLVCFGLLVLSTLRLFLPAVMHMYSYHKKAHTMLDMQNAVDILMHDLWQASSDKKQWHIYTNTYVLWSAGTETIGWQNTPEGIVRIQGEYNPLSKIWHKKTQNLVAPHIQMRCNVEDTFEKILWIQITIEHQKESLDVLWSFYGR